MNKIELLMSAKKYGVVSKEYLQSKLYEKYSHTFSINDCVLAAELVTNSILITKDNIHLYYEFMNPGQKMKYYKILNELFNNRLDIVAKRLDIDKNELLEFCTMDAKVTSTEVFYISLCCFSAKDTLKPIYQYITEIKASEKYLTYLIKQYYDFCEIKELQKGYYELVDIGSNKLILNGCLDDIMEYINNAKNYKDLA
ncbi:hypothetical protein [Brevundimonas sp. FT23042]|uniref:hypothetical protein n=1 Tax=Brevundimonas sp. FT23042 TaxID=3393749 RepID=UPI003B587700